MVALVTQALKVEKALPDEVVRLMIMSLLTQLSLCFVSIVASSLYNNKNKLMISSSHSVFIFHLIS